MKLQVNRHELADALALAGSVAAARTPKPILQCVLLRALPDSLELEATDLEIGFRCVVSQVEVDEEGAVLVPAEKLGAVVRESADEILALEADTALCHLRGADSHFQINAQDTAEFPAVATMAGDPDFEVREDMLRVLAERTTFAAARESTRYAINGVLWEKTGKTLNLVATDGRRLALASGELADAGGRDASAIVPSKVMSLLQRVFAGGEEMVGIKLAGNQILARGRKATLSSALVEGHFPKYQDVIPQDGDKRVTLNAAETHSAVKRAALLTNEESRGVRFSFADNRLSLASRAPQEGEAQVSISVGYESEPVEIGFNPNFLTDVLRVLHVDEVTLDLKEANRPGVLCAGPNFKYVIMPVNLS